MLVLVNELLLEQPVPLTALAIYWALALLYVGGSRLLARQLLVLRPRESERVVDLRRGRRRARRLASVAVRRPRLRCRSRSSTTTGRCRAA